MAPVIRYRRIAVLKTIMLMTGKKNQIIPGTQAVMITVLDDVEISLDTDNYDKRIYTALLVDKIR
jgi:hypothetical protein